jgi:hypothetical protein
MPLPPAPSHMRNGFVQRTMSMVDQPPPPPGFGTPTCARGTPFLKKFVSSGMRPLYAFYIKGSETPKASRTGLGEEIGRSGLDKPIGLW